MGDRTSFSCPSHSGTPHSVENPLDPLPPGNILAWTDQPSMKMNECRAERGSDTVAARTVTWTLVASPSWILHSCTKSPHLPWPHRQRPRRWMMNENACLRLEPQRTATIAEGGQRYIVRLSTTRLLRHLDELKLLSSGPTT